MQGQSEKPTVAYVGRLAAPQDMFTSLPEGVIQRLPGKPPKTQYVPCPGCGALAPKYPGLEVCNRCGTSLSDAEVVHTADFDPYAKPNGFAPNYNAAIFKMKDGTIHEHDEPLLEHAEIMEKYGLPRDETVDWGHVGKDGSYQWYNMPAASVTWRDDEQGWTAKTAGQMITPPAHWETPTTYRDDVKVTPLTSAQVYGKFFRQGDKWYAWSTPEDDGRPAHHETNEWHDGQAEQAGHITNGVWEDYWGGPKENWQDADAIADEFLAKTASEWLTPPGCRPWVPNDPEAAYYLVTNDGQHYRWFKELHSEIAHRLGLKSQGSRTYGDSGTVDKEGMTHSYWAGVPDLDLSQFTSAAPRPGDPDPAQLPDGTRALVLKDGSWIVGTTEDTAKMKHHHQIAMEHGLKSADIEAYAWAYGGQWSFLGGPQAKQRDAWVDAGQFTAGAHDDTPEDELHVSCPVSEAQRNIIQDWADAQDWPEGFEHESWDELHVTLLYAKDGYDENKDEPWLAEGVNFDFSIESLDTFPEGDNGYPVVLRLKSPDAKEHGETLLDTAEKEGLDITRFDGGFKPHMTIGYSPTDDLGDIEPPHQITLETEPTEVSVPRARRTGAYQSINWQVQESDFDPAKSYMTGDHWTHSPWLAVPSTGAIHLGPVGSHHADLHRYHGVQGQSYEGIVDNGSVGTYGGIEDAATHVDVMSALRRHLGPGFDYEHFSDSPDYEDVSQSGWTSKRKPTSEEESHVGWVTKLTGWITKKTSRDADSRLANLPETDVSHDVPLEPTEPHYRNYTPGTAWLKTNDGAVYMAEGQFEAHPELVQRHGIDPNSIIEYGRGQHPYDPKSIDPKYFGGDPMGSGLDAWSSKAEYPTPPGFKPWELGGPGKGIVLRDGREFRWRTDPASGYPAHFNATEALGQGRDYDRAYYIGADGREIRDEDVRQFNAEGWTASADTFANHPERPWQPGSYGRFLIDADGHEWRSDMSLTHGGLMATMGHDYQDGGYISPEGERRPWTGAEELEALRAEGWTAKTAATYLTPPGEPEWQRGEMGKGLTVNGVDYRWATQGGGDGDPTHMDVCYMLADGDVDEAENLWGSAYGYWVTPDGRAVTPGDFDAMEGGATEGWTASTQPSTPPGFKPYSGGQGRYLVLNDGTEYQWDADPLLGPHHYDAYAALDPQWREHGYRVLGIGTKAEGYLPKDQGSSQWWTASMPQTAPEPANLEDYENDNEEWRYLVDGNDKLHTWPNQIHIQYMNDHYINPATVKDYGAWNPEEEKWYSYVDQYGSLPELRDFYAKTATRPPRSIPGLPLYRLGAPGRYIRVGDVEYRWAIDPEYEALHAQAWHMLGRPPGATFGYLDENGNEDASQPHPYDVDEEGWTASAPSAARSMSSDADTPRMPSRPYDWYSEGDVDTWEDEGGSVSVSPESLTQSDEIPANLPSQTNLPREVSRTGTEYSSARLSLPAYLARLDLGPRQGSVSQGLSMAKDGADAVSSVLQPRDLALNAHTQTLWEEGVRPLGSSLLSWEGESPSNILASIRLGAQAGWQHPPGEIHPWTEGDQAGRFIVSPQGVEYRWRQPEHGTIIRRLGLDWDDVRANGDIGWLVNGEKRSRSRQQIAPSVDDEGWTAKVGAAGDWQTPPGCKPWTPGVWGRYLVGPRGEQYAWDVRSDLRSNEWIDEDSGNVERDVGHPDTYHFQVMKALGLDADERGYNSGWKGGYIEPDGAVGVQADAVPGAQDLEGWTARVSAESANDGAAFLYYPETDRLIMGEGGYDHEGDYAEMHADIEPMYGGDGDDIRGRVTGPPGRGQFVDWYPHSQQSPEAFAKGHARVLDHLGIDPKADPHPLENQRPWEGYDVNDPWGFEAAYDGWNDTRVRDRLTLDRKALSYFIMDDGREIIGKPNEHHGEMRRIYGIDPAHVAEMGYVVNGEKVPYKDETTDARIEGWTSRTGAEAWVTPSRAPKWLPGTYGRFLIDDDGTEYRWGADGHGTVEGHVEVARRLNLSNDNWGYIMPDGEHSYSFMDWDDAKQEDYRAGLGEWQASTEPMVPGPYQVNLPRENVDDSYDQTSIGQGKPWSLGERGRVIYDNNTGRHWEWAYDPDSQDVHHYHVHENEPDLSTYPGAFDNKPGVMHYNIGADGYLQAWRGEGNHLALGTGRYRGLQQWDRGELVKQDWDGKQLVNPQGEGLEEGWTAKTADASYERDDLLPDDHQPWHPGVSGSILANPANKNYITWDRDYSPNGEDQLHHGEMQNHVWHQDQYAIGDDFADGDITPGGEIQWYSIPAPYTVQTLQDQMPEFRHKHQDWEEMSHDAEGWTSKLGWSGDFHRPPGPTILHPTNAPGDQVNVEQCQRCRGQMGPVRQHGAKFMQSCLNCGRTQMVPFTHPGVSQWNLSAVSEPAVYEWDEKDMADAGQASLSGDPNDPWAEKGYRQRRPLVYDRSTNSLHIGPLDYAHTELTRMLRHNEQGDGPYHYGWHGYNPEAMHRDEANYGWYDANVPYEVEQYARRYLQVPDDTEDSSAGEWRARTANFGEHTEGYHVPEGFPGPGEEMGQAESIEGRYLRKKDGTEFRWGGDWPHVTVQDALRIPWDQVERTGYIYPEKEPTDWTAKIAAQIPAPEGTQPWVPGSYGKAILWPEGNLQAWAVPEYEDEFNDTKGEGTLHHVDLDNPRNESGAIHLAISPDGSAGRVTQGISFKENEEDWVAQSDPNDPYALHPDDRFRSFTPQQEQILQSYGLRPVEMESYDAFQGGGDWDFGFTASALPIVTSVDEAVPGESSNPVTPGPAQGLSWPSGRPIEPWQPGLPGKGFIVHYGTPDEQPHLWDATDRREEGTNFEGHHIAHPLGGMANWFYWVSPEGSYTYGFNPHEEAGEEEGRRVQSLIESQHPALHDELMGRVSDDYRGNAFEGWTAKVDDQGPLFFASTIPEERWNYGSD